MMQSQQQQQHQIQHHNNLQLQQFKKDSNIPGLDPDDDGGKKKVKITQNCLLELFN